jgi:hypothetical protein
VRNLLKVWWQKYLLLTKKNNNTLLTKIKCTLSTNTTYCNELILSSVSNNVYFWSTMYICLSTKCSFCQTCVFFSTKCSFCQCVFFVNNVYFCQQYVVFVDNKCQFSNLLFLGIWFNVYRRPWNKWYICMESQYYSWRNLFVFPHRKISVYTNWTCEMRKMQFIFFVPPKIWMYPQKWR